MRSIFEIRTNQKESALKRSYSYLTATSANGADRPKIKQVV